MILIAVFSRLLPHPPNFTPIMSIALFSGTYFSKKILAFIIPITAMILTDFVLGFHESILAVYLSFAIIVLLGNFIAKKLTVKNVIISSMASAVLFFVLTNLSVWLFGPFYSKDISGLIQCFIAALAFFRYEGIYQSMFVNTFISSLFYSGLLFGSYELIKRKYPILSKV